MIDVSVLFEGGFEEFDVVGIFGDVAGDICDVVS